MANIERVSTIQLIKKPTARIDVRTPGQTEAEKIRDIMGYNKKIKIPGVGKVAFELKPGEEKPHVISTKGTETTVTPIVDRGEHVDRSEKFAAEIPVGQRIVTVVFPVQEVMGPEMARRREEYEKMRDANVFPTVEEFYKQVEERNNNIAPSVFGPKRSKPFYKSPSPKQQS